MTKRTQTFVYPVRDTMVDHVRLASRRNWTRRTIQVVLVINVVFKDESQVSSRGTPYEILEEIAILLFIISCGSRSDRFDIDRVTIVNIHGCVLSFKTVSVYLEIVKQG